MNGRFFRAAQMPDQIILGRVIHEETHRAEIDTVNRNVVLHYGMKRFQHHTVATERDDDISVLYIDTAISILQTLKSCKSVRALA